MTAPAPWLCNEPAPDWRAATVAELVEAWKNGRNAHGAMMAADELMRRVAAGRMDVREAGDQGRD